MPALSLTAWLRIFTGLAFVLGLMLFVTINDLASLRIFGS